eukprot:2453027-Pyramimonas_sp.AAC.1
MPNVIAVRPVQGSTGPVQVFPPKRRGARKAAEADGDAGAGDDDPDEMGDLDGDEGDHDDVIEGGASGAP